LRADAEEASKLRAEVRNRDLEFERVSSELESKKELVRALRRDTDGVDRVRTESKREVEELKAKLQRAEAQATKTAQELAALREADHGKKDEEHAELEALRADLEARKTLIKSLRSDQERIAPLQASLQEKQEIISQLEAAMNKHSGTITELKRSVETWKRKYLALKGDSPTATTSVNLPSLADTDVRVIEQLDKKAGGLKQEATIAIDMRRSLLEARRSSPKGHAEK
jgi:chromosome segregation ATPase